METLQQLNKTISQGIRVQSVNSILFLLLIFSVHCAGQKISRIDKSLASFILSSQGKKNEAICLNRDNENSRVIAMLYDLNKCSEQECDSLLRNYGIEKEDYLGLIKPNLKHLLSQKDNSFWTADLICKSKEANLSISKPVYTANKKFAFVEIALRTSRWIGIYKRQKQGWVEYKLVSPNFISPRVHLR